MGAYREDTDFVIKVLSVCVLCAASGKMQSCVLNNSQFLEFDIRLQMVFAYYNMG